MKCLHSNTFELMQRIYLKMKCSELCRITALNYVLACFIHKRVSLQSLNNRLRKQCKSLSTNKVTGSKLTNVFLCTVSNVTSERRMVHQYLSRMYLHSNLRNTTRTKQLYLSPFIFKSLKLSCNVTIVELCLYELVEREIVFQHLPD